MFSSDRSPQPRAAAVEMLAASAHAQRPSSGDGGSPKRARMDGSVEPEQGLPAGLFAYDSD